MNKAEIETTVKKDELVSGRASLSAGIIELKSEQLLEELEGEEAQLKDLYDKMLDDTSEEMYKTVKSEAFLLKRSAVNLGRGAAMAAAMDDELSARWHDLTKRKRKGRRLASPANALVDEEELNSGHFARGINFYKLVLLCSAGSFIGVIIEMLWCLVTRGYIESRAGLVYGPFNLLYGAGAVVLTVCLYGLRNRGAWLSFAGGLVVGSAVEYVCSFLQELVFGSRSWDYSRMPFNINGRICLVYSVFWGILGVLWIKSIYPRLAQWILKIPQKEGKIVTWLLVVFFTLNAAVTVVAVGRWSMREKGVPADNGFWELVDERFPDERMEHIFANMKFN